MAGSFGAPLDLGETLGEQAPHYRAALAGQDLTVPVTRQSIAPPAPGDWVTPEPGQLWDAGPLQIERFSAELPDVASSCTDLAVCPEICWDVCGYYRDLGVHWRATRWELLIAYNRRAGQRSPRLTYVLKQLLREGGAVRRRYDAMALGQLFLEDRDTELMLIRAADRAARKRDASAEDVLAEWGLNSYRKDQPPGEPEAPAETALQAGDNDTVMATGNDWWLGDWGWYGVNIWQIPARAGETLAEWQRLLAAAFADAGMTVRFAVGLDPSLPACLTRTWPNGPNGSAIFFTGTEHPIPAMAAEAVREYTKLNVTHP